MHRFINGQISLQNGKDSIFMYNCLTIIVALRRVGLSEPCFAFHASRYFWKWLLQESTGQVCFLYYPLCKCSSMIFSNQQLFKNSLCYNFSEISLRGNESEFHMLLWPRTLPSCHITATDMYRLYDPASFFSFGKCESEYLCCQ